jgi:hypothetical protein
MKYVLFFIMLITSLTVNAAPFRLKVTPVGEDQIVSYDPNDWEFIAKESHYTVNIAKGEIENNKGFMMVQSNTTYDGHEVYSYMEKPVKRVFTYGALDCSEKKFYILGELFSAEDNTVQMIRYHEWGEWVSDLNGEGTARNAVYKRVCNTSI